MKLAISLLLLGIAFAAQAADKERAPTRNQFYGAIAYHAPTNNAGWATDRKSSREARLEALKQCGHESCVVVATVTRGCAALARGPKQTFVQKGTTQQEAQTKALGKCGKGCEIAAWVCTK